MKTNTIIIMLIICIIALIGCIIYDNIKMVNNKIENSTSIDKYYLPKLNSELSTYEVSNVADQYMNAWKNEFINIVNIIKGNLVFEEDKQIFDNYYKQYEQLALISAEAEYLKYVDINQPIDNRFAGTASSYASVLAMMYIYKQGAINLIKYYEDLNEKNSYQYIFRGES